jgi:hypothetical protein
MGPDGRPWHSWRTLLLPYVDQRDLYRRYRFDEPWDSPHNRNVCGVRVSAYDYWQSPTPIPGTTRFVAVVGRDTVIGRTRSASVSQLQEAKSVKKLVAVCSPHVVIPWSCPVDLDLEGPDWKKELWGEGLSRLPFPDVWGIRADGARVDLLQLTEEQRVRLLRIDPPRDGVVF